MCHAACFVVFPTVTLNAESSLVKIHKYAKCAQLSGNESDVGLLVYKDPYNYIKMQTTTTRTTTIPFSPYNGVTATGEMFGQDFHEQHLSRSD